LADEPRAGSAYGWGERPWIAKRKHDGGGPMSKSGDQVITKIADLCQQEKRKSDIVARFGGEEF